MAVVQAVRRANTYRRLRERTILLLAAAVGLGAGLISSQLTHPSEQLEGVMLVLVVLAAGVGALVTFPPVHAQFLPFARAVAGYAGRLLLFGAAGWALMSFALPELLLVAGSAVTGMGVGRVLRSRSPHRAGRPIRVAVLDEPHLATMLRLEAQDGPSRNELEVIGWMGSAETASDGCGGWLGPVESIDDLVHRHHLDVVVTAPGSTTPEAAERLVTTCFESNVRAVDFVEFYERQFGRVPIGAIDTAWLRRLVDPDRPPPGRRAKRAFDLVVAVPVLTLAAPVMLLLALAVRTDGGPALFRQIRVGAGGKPFEILKFRTMRVTTAEGAARWSSRSDDRVTRVGQVLRRTHLDELPQLLNIVRGDMSLVGPRPEQSEFAAALHHELPFYDQRHLVRPGLTGWAQVRAGYAGSLEGSAMKLCNDLYYVKHRSLALDLAVLVETARTLVADRQWEAPTMHPQLLALASAQHPLANPSTPQPAGAGAVE
jgi:exopolysaccharide biosynthesis polyprenyl glycosylphosphotransferase